MFLRTHFAPEAPKHAAATLSRNHQRAASAVFIFYLFSVFTAYAILLPTHLDARLEAPAYRWPVAWIGALGWDGGPQFVGIATFVSALACSLTPGSRIWRAVFAVCALMLVALSNSYGAVNHGYHLWVWIAIFLAFAPRDLSSAASRKDKLGLIATIAGVQAFVLSTYSLAGLHKIKGGIFALAQGEEGNFSLTGFASQIADRVIQTDAAPVAADLIITHAPIFAPLFWILIVCQSAAIAVAFFPRLHRTFGFIMIGFHFGTWALMEISFPHHVFWLMLFFVFSPFRPSDNADSPVVLAKDAAGYVARHTARLLSAAKEERKATAPVGAKTKTAD
jgi:hypothetical protein